MLHVDMYEAENLMQKVNTTGADYMGLVGSNHPWAMLQGKQPCRKIFSRQAAKVSFCFFVKPKNSTDITSTFYYPSACFLCKKHIVQTCYLYYLCTYCTNGLENMWRFFNFSNLSPFC